MTFSGIVEKGSGVGTRTGFPTANIVLTDPSVSGIYAAIVQVEGKSYRAAVYADQKRKLLESHLLDFSGDLYGKEISVTLEKKMRDDMTFTDETALLAQIKSDIEAVREHTP